MGLCVAVVGCGRFGSQFIGQHVNHPDVEKMYLCDERYDRALKVANKWNIPKENILTTYDDVLSSDAVSVSIFAQRHLHGPMVIKALEAGKHVGCAVPLTIDVDEGKTIVSLVEKSGLIFSTFETDIYIAAVIYCRERYRAGDFGRFTFAQSSYNHDMSHFIDPYKHSAGENWKRVAGIPPLFYATHTVSRILSVTGAHITKVCAFGVLDYNEDEIFRAGNNDWDNPFANETALMRTSDGGSIRINEFRRAVNPSSVGTNLLFQGENATYVDGGRSGRSLFAFRSGEHGEKVEELDLTTILTCTDFKGPIDNDIPVELRDGFFSAEAPLHHIERLPKSYRDIRNGHNGSHHFLIDDFICCVAQDKHPRYTNVWEAAKFCLPGLVAHRSAMQGGELIDVPFLGDAPTDLEYLDKDENAFESKIWL